MNKKILFLVFLSVLFLPVLVSAINTPEVMARNIQNMVWYIGSTIVVIGWTVAGILYLLSMGSPEKMGTAKKAIIAAVIGTVLVVIAGLGYLGVKEFLNQIIGA